MLSLPSSTRILAAVEPVDMRKSFNGLFAIASGELKEDPTSGALFLFANRRRDRLKILYWDGTGLWVLAKRLEKGRFTWPSAGAASVALRAEAFNQLLCGVQLDALSMKPWYQR
jgi:transposase